MSDFSQPPQDPFVSAQVVEKKGMSGGAKVLLILGIIFLVFIVVCCGGGIIFSIVAGKAMQDMITEDPVKVAQGQAQVLDIEIPESFTPKAMMDMAIPFTEQRLMTMIIYQGQSPQDSLVLVGIGEMMSQMPQQDMERQIDQSLRQQGIGQPQPGASWEAESKEFTIAGQPTQFMFRTEKDQDGQPTQFNVTGTVPGKRGPVMVIINVSAESMSEEEIDAVIQSIQ